MSENEEKFLTVICPTCDEELEIPAHTWQDFELGDVLVCDSCSTQLEVISKDPPEFELLAEFVDCPDCGEEIEIEDKMLENGIVQCPSCHTEFELEVEENNQWH